MDKLNNLLSAIPRGFTSGELSQIKKRGYSDKGSMSVEALYLHSVKSWGEYFSKTEPGGQVMNAAEKIAEDLRIASESICNAGRLVKETSEVAIREMIESGRKVRDQNTKLSESINSFLKTAQKPEFTKAIADAERLASALEKIAELEKTGTLSKLAALIK